MRMTMKPKFSNIPHVNWKPGAKPLPADPLRWRMARAKMERGLQPASPSVPSVTSCSK